jgi:hypothetical protein
VTLCAKVEKLSRSLFPKLFLIGFVEFKEIDCELILGRTFYGFFGECDLVLWKKKLGQVGCDPLVILDPHMIARLTVGRAVSLNNSGSRGRPTFVEKFAEESLHKNGLIAKPI